MGLTVPTLTVGIWTYKTPCAENSKTFRWKASGLRLRLNFMDRVDGIVALRS